MGTLPLRISGYMLSSLTAGKNSIQTEHAQHNGTAGGTFFRPQRRCEPELFPKGVLQTRSVTFLPDERDRSPLNPPRQKAPLGLTLIVRLARRARDPSIFGREGMLQWDVDINSFGKRDPSEIGRGE